MEAKMSNDVTNPFSVGDVVRLKSGSPDMTVVNFQEDKIKCVWSVPEDPNGMRYNDFPPATLELARSALPRQAPSSQYRSDPASYLRAQEGQSIPVPSDTDLRWHASHVRRIQSGANYVAGEVIYLQCGDGDDPIVVRVTAAVLGGAITDIVLQSPGSYKERRGTLRQSSTTGIGSDATFEVQGWFRD